MERSYFVSYQLTVCYHMCNPQFFVGILSNEYAFRKIKLDKLMWHSGSLKLCLLCILFIGRKAGDNTFGSLRSSVCLLCCGCSPVVREYAFYTMHMLRSGRYMGSACRVLRKITMTHEIQSKISVCLSVIKERSRSRAARSSRGLLHIVACQTSVVSTLN